MELTLFTIVCQNEDCGYAFMSNSEEHRVCPCCGEENLVYEGAHEATVTQDLSLGLDDLLRDQETVLAGMILANAYVCGDSCIARYDDSRGFRFNLFETPFMNEMVTLLNLSSIEAFKEYVYDRFDVHAYLIYDPIFNCITREFYHDEDHELYESGHVRLSDAQCFYDWFEANSERVIALFR